MKQYYPIEEDFQILVEGPSEGNQLILKERHDKYLVGEWVSYELPDPFACPLAVSGITRYRASVLVGKRDRVNAFSGCWELAPSGGIDLSALRGGFIDYRYQLLKELEEETGIASQHVTKITPLYAVYDQDLPLIDICMEIIVTKGDLRTNGEYSELFWVPVEKLVEIEGEWVPLSWDLIEKVLL